jgi:3-deoxy-manno-octulosonate cytidylyltransferase (CMP-KDO synthetase)
MKTIIIIPSRLSATRLPGKPLLKINGLSIISHVFKRAEKANIGDVFVAAEDQEIVDDVKKNGGQAILTSKQNKTGTDRIYEAIKKLDIKNIELVMNLQGDEPMMNIDDIISLNTQMIKNKSNLGTLGSEISDNNIYKNQNIVKVITRENLNISKFSEAIAFKRKIVNQRDNIYHHLGIYCYELDVLKKFVSFKQTENEIRYKLEQLRALDNDVKVHVGLAKSSPIGVDTQEDFVAIKKIMEYKP